jgi:hypothetical protein
MSEQASFEMHGRNPDVLTCIANLSNDEVFTPPEFANRMLDTLEAAWVFNTEQMNQAVFAFRRYEDASLRYTGIESHQGMKHVGLYDTVVARE